MITRIEIDGFKTFENFKLDLRPFTAIVGPNASGKSNLFDALRFLSLLSQKDVRAAMQELRGNPEELFRQSPLKTFDTMTFAVEVLLEAEHIDDFGEWFILSARRLRYEIRLRLAKNNFGNPNAVYVDFESCRSIPRSEEKSAFVRSIGSFRSYRKTPFLSTETDSNEVKALVIRQDGFAESGVSKRGRGVRLAAQGATRTALSTVTTSEFPHLYALRSFLASVNFLEINPNAARLENDRFEKKELKSDASNLAAVLAHIKEISSDDNRDDGALSDISNDLSYLIPSVKKVEVSDIENSKEYSFYIQTVDNLRFSSRVISDGTIRLLALLSIINNPERNGVLCFEEPENGVHEGRIPALIQTLRDAANYNQNGSVFQIILNTHSPAVLGALHDSEIVVADIVRKIDKKTGDKAFKTRMRTEISDGVLEFDSDAFLTRSEISKILRKIGSA